MLILDINPKIGDIRKAKDIGKRGGHSFIWASCPKCGKERWVALIKGKPKWISCRCRFRGITHPCWKGGRHKDVKGRIKVWISPDDFFYPMAGNNHQVLEHRLVMAKSVNRCLLSWEVVHHINGDKSDNRIENLELLPHGRFHLVDSTIKKRIADLERRVILLEAENTELRRQIEQTVSSVG